MPSTPGKRRSCRRSSARASFTLEDYLDQFRRVRKMGSLQSLIEMIPGARGQVDESQIDEQEMKREEAIILSMTRTGATESSHHRPEQEKADRPRQRHRGV